MGRQRPAAERLPSQRAPLSELVEKQIAESDEMIELRKQLALAESQRGTQRRRADQLEKENEKLREQLAARAEPRGKLGKSARYEHAIKFADEFDGYDTSDILPIWVGALRHLGERRQVDLRGQLARSKFFKPVVTMVEVQRDIKICTYLKEKVFPAAAFALSRLLINISKRECQLLNQIFKHERHADGTKNRWRLCAGSTQFAPELFSLIGINEIEKNSLDATGITFSQSEDRWSATVAGAPFSVDKAFMNNLEQASVSRVGGMATAGTKEDPHIFNETGDGAGLSNAFSGVRGGISPGSSEYLAQSSRDITTMFMYKATNNAEEWTTLKANLAPLRKQWARIYRERELQPDGKPSGIFVELVLTADKPFVRHVNGLRSHNHKSFGAPYCGCQEGQLFDFSKCKRTHYGQITYEMLCHRAHVPLHEALGEEEPAEWSMTCDKCNKVRLSSPNIFIITPPGVTLPRASRHVVPHPFLFDETAVNCSHFPSRPS